MSASASGYLEKRSDKLKRYNKRFVEIVGSKAMVYTREGGKLRCILQMTGTTRIGDCSEKPNAKAGDRFEFEVALPTRTVRLCARQREAKLAWISAFFDAIDVARAEGPITSTAEPAAGEHSGSGSDGTVETAETETDAPAPGPDGGLRLFSRIKQLGKGGGGNGGGGGGGASQADIAALTAQVGDLRLQLEQTQAALAAEREERVVYEETLRKMEAETLAGCREYDAQIAGLMEEIRTRDDMIEVFRTQLGGQRWVDDSTRSECRRCLEGFSFTKRKHHCRRCGDIFCGSCCSSVPLIVGQKGGETIKVCLDCALLTTIL